MTWIFWIFIVAHTSFSDALTQTAANHQGAVINFGFTFKGFLMSSILYFIINGVILKNAF